MARIVYPTDFLRQKSLSESIKLKHDSDGALSPLNAFLIQNEIDLNADSSAATAALAYDKSSRKLAGESEKFNAKREKKFNPVFKNLNGSFQFLKKFYQSMSKEVGLWGAPITITGRINYPADFLARTEIFNALKTKSDSFIPPANNPLLPYFTQNQVTLADDAAAVAEAITLNSDAQTKAMQSEAATKNRNNLWNPVMEHIRKIGAFLMQLYKDNPKQLIDWGFTVDHSPRKSKTVNSKVKLSSKKKATNVIIGSTFGNTGTVALNVHKGKTTKTPAVTVLPGETLEITKGMSIITIVNTSSTTTGTFTTIRS